jgi:hypothetical protein
MTILENDPRLKTFMRFIRESIKSETDPAKVKAIEVEGSMIAKEAAAWYEQLVAQRNQDKEKEEEDSGL